VSVDPVVTLLPRHAGVVVTGTITCSKPAVATLTADVAQFNPGTGHPRVSGSARLDQPCDGPTRYALEVRTAVEGLRFRPGEISGQVTATVFDGEYYDYDVVANTWRVSPT
jgi:hypothetical protein